MANKVQSQTVKKLCTIWKPFYQNWANCVKCLTVLQCQCQNQKDKTQTSLSNKEHPAKWTLRQHLQDTLIALSVRLSCCMFLVSAKGQLHDLYINRCNMKTGAFVVVQGHLWSFSFINQYSLNLHIQRHKKKSTKITKQKKNRRGSK